MMILTLLQAFVTSASFRKSGFKTVFPILFISKILSTANMSLSCSATEVGENNNNNNIDNNIDSIYPGTAVTRMINIRKRVQELTVEQLNGDWSDVRRNILWAGGLKDLPHSAPGQGYTGHSFNDFNHCDLTAMRGDEVENTNQGRVSGIAYSNKLGSGIKIASLPELGPGGSWSTCMIGCQKEPPQDVAHLQFRARIAFKLVWAPPSFDSFVLIDDDGKLLASGKPTGILPDMTERTQNYRVVRGSKYAMEADRLSTLSSQGNSTRQSSGTS